MNLINQSIYISAAILAATISVVMVLQSDVYAQNSSGKIIIPPVIGILTQVYKKHECRFFEFLKTC